MENSGAAFQGNRKAGHRSNRTPGIRVLEEQIQWYSDNNCFKDLNRIDGQPMEFEWKIFPGFTTVAILNQDSTDDGRIYSVNQGT